VPGSPPACPAEAGVPGAVWGQLITADSRMGFSFRAKTVFLGKAKQTELRAV